MRGPIAAVLILIGALSARPQGVNPVYVDDSTAARDTLARLLDLVAVGNLGESVRSLQRLLDGEAHRALELPGDSEIFVTVRRRVHDALRSDAALLDMYRQVQGPVADLHLSRGEHARVETSYFLTSAGAIATLRVAQSHLEAARFEAARISLDALSDHPDARAASVAGPAAALAAQVARYLDRPEVWAWAGAFRARAGLDPGVRGSVIDAPQGLFERHSSALTRGERPVIGDMVWTPIRSAPFASRVAEERAGALDAVRRAAGQQPIVEPAWAFPAIVGEMVYINDGATIAALDRFTLEERWRTRPMDAQGRYEPLEFGRRPNERAYSRGFDDGSSVLLTRGVVLATTGVATGNGRSGDPRVHAIDRATGRVIWSVDVSDLDPQLSGGSVRGPLLVDGTTVIVSVRKHVPQRRLMSVALVGLDLEDGSLRWATTIGSAGIQTTSRGGRSAEGATLHRGIVYRTDEVGVISAVEASSGRIVWIRRAPSAALMNTMMGWPWGTVIPIIDEGADGSAGGLVTLTPDRLDVVRLDLRTGRLLASRSSGSLEQPRYLVRIGRDLAAIGDRRIAFVDFAMFESAPVRTSGAFEGDSGAMSGRAFDAGGLLAVPTRSGLTLIDPANPREPIVVPLERSGNLAIAGGQVIVADHRELHNYLVWDVASAMLRERMERAGDDASPAITFAGLASRSRRWEDVAPALDRAITIVERGAGSPVVEPARVRIVTLLGSLLGASAIGWNVGSASADVPGATPRIDDLALLDVLVDRLGRVCSSPEEQVLHAMMLGRLRTGQSRISEAIEVYQRVLAEPVLAEATYRTPGLSLRAATEATVRLREVLQVAGPRAYDAFELEARGAVAQSSGDPARLRATADRYPASAASVGALRRAATARLAAGDRLGAISDLRSAAGLIDWAMLTGVPIDVAEASEVAGLLLVTLADAEQVDALAATRDRVRRWGGVVPVAQGRGVDAESAVREASARAAERSRLARVGAPAGADVAQALVGWTLARSISAERDGSPTVALLVAADGRAIAGYGTLESGSGVEQLWKRDCDAAPRVLWHDARAIYVQWGGLEGGTIERIDPRTGEGVWVSPTLRTLFPLDALAQRRLLDPIGRPQTIPTPTAGPVALTDLLVALDGGTLALAERGGRIASIDAATGRVRYTTRTAVDRVYEVALGGGMLLVGGASERQAALDQPVELSPVLAALDASTLRTLSVSRDLPGDVAWMRVDGNANLLAGFDEGILSMAPESGRRNWVRFRDPADRFVDAWVLGRSIFLMDNARLIWIADGATGQIADDPLRTDDRLSTRQRIVGRVLGDRVAFVSARGVVIYGADGRRIGSDAIGAMDSLIPARFCADVLVTIDTRATESAEGRRTYTLSVMDNTSARLIASREIALLVPPDGLGVLDGRILVSAGGVTMVIGAPAP
ncbi:MAG: PQQ-binding-like beta-propeller repeat protein [Phycisphaeraceae bacterium]|nr:MAG: PQQ-binding-like beta-propeller repeat protein [Phycisphaeraceae bacterium]